MENNNDDYLETKENTQLKVEDIKRTNQPVNPQTLDFEVLNENVRHSSAPSPRKRNYIRERCECKRRGLNCGTSQCINRTLRQECTSSTCGVNKSECANRCMQKKAWRNVEIRDAGVKGHGLFAAETIEADAFVLEYYGEIIGTSEFHRRNKESGHRYFMALDDGVFLDPSRRGSIARFMNHCCEPNCVMEIWTVKGELRACVFTTKEVGENEELTFDYGWEPMARKPLTKCSCGALTCRQFLEDWESFDQDPAAHRTGTWEIPSGAPLILHNSLPRPTGTVLPIGLKTPSPDQELVERRIRVWWDGNEDWFDADIIAYDPVKKLHLLQYCTDGEQGYEDLAGYVEKGPLTNKDDHVSKVLPNGEPYLGLLYTNPEDLRYIDPITNCEVRCSIWELLNETGNSSVQEVPSLPVIPMLKKKRLPVEKSSSNQSVKRKFTQRIRSSEFRKSEHSQTSSFSFSSSLSSSNSMSRASSSSPKSYSSKPKLQRSHSFPSSSSSSFSSISSNSTQSSYQSFNHLRGNVKSQLKNECQIAKIQVKDCEVMLGGLDIQKHIFVGNLIIKNIGEHSIVFRVQFHSKGYKIAAEPYKLNPNNDLSLTSEPTTTTTHDGSDGSEDDDGDLLDFPELPSLAPDFGTIPPNGSVTVRINILKTDIDKLRQCIIYRLLEHVTINDLGSIVGGLTSRGIWQLHLPLSVDAICCEQNEEELIREQGPKKAQKLFYELSSGLDLSEHRIPPPPPSSSSSSSPPYQNYETVATGPIPLPSSILPPGYVPMPPPGLPLVVGSSMTFVPPPPLPKPSTVFVPPQPLLVSPPPCSQPPPLPSSSLQPPLPTPSLQPPPLPSPSLQPPLLTTLQPPLPTPTPSRHSRRQLHCSLVIDTGVIVENAKREAKKASLNAALAAANDQKKTQADMYDEEDDLHPVVNPDNGFRLAMENTDDGNKEKESDSERRKRHKSHSSSHSSSRKEKVKNCGDLSSAAIKAGWRMKLSARHAGKPYYFRLRHESDVIWSRNEMEAHVEEWLKKHRK